LEDWPNAKMLGREVSNLAMAIQKMMFLPVALAQPKNLDGWQAKEQSSCSEMTDSVFVKLWEPLRRAFGSAPPGTLPG
jgi:hypothetical protein